MVDRLGLPLWNAEIQSHVLRTQRFQPIQLLFMCFEEVLRFADLIKQVREIVVADHRRES